MPKERMQENVRHNLKMTMPPRGCRRMRKRGSAVLHLWQPGIAYACPACTQEQPWDLG